MHLQSYERGTLSIQKLTLQVLSSKYFMLNNHTLEIDGQNNADTSDTDDKHEEN